MFSSYRHYYICLTLASSFTSLFASRAEQPEQILCQLTKTPFLVFLFLGVKTRSISTFTPAPDLVYKIIYFLHRKSKQKRWHVCSSLKASLWYSSASWYEKIVSISALVSICSTLFSSYTRLFGSRADNRTITPFQIMKRLFLISSIFRL